MVLKLISSCYLLFSRVTVKHLSHLRLFIKIAKQPTYRRIGCFEHLLKRPGYKENKTNQQTTNKTKQNKPANKQHKNKNKTY